MTATSRQFKLTDSDLQMFARSYVTPELINAARVSRVASPEGARLIGRNGNGDHSGLAFPNTWSGEDTPREYSLRLDHPELEQKADGTGDDDARG